MKSTFRILFYARWEKLKEDGKVPLMARVTVDGQKVKFGLKADVTPQIWEPKAGRAIGQSKEAVLLNRYYLDSIKGQLIAHFHRLAETQGVVTAMMLKDAFLGCDVKTNTLLAVFKEEHRFFKADNQAFRNAVT